MIVCLCGECPSCGRFLLIADREARLVRRNRQFFAVWQAENEANVGREPTKREARALRLCQRTRAELEHLRGDFLEGEPVG